MIFFYFLISLCFIIYPFQFLKAETISLEECLKKASQNHPSLLKYKSILAEADYKIKNKLAAFYPEINVSLSYLKSSSDYFNPATGLVETEKNDMYGVSLNFNQIVFNKMSRYYGFKIAQVEKSMDEKNFSEAQKTIYFTLKELYFSVLLYQKQIEILKKIIQRRQHNYVIIKLSYNSGKEKITAVLEAEANVKQAEYDLTEKIENLQLSKKIINLLIGDPQEKNYVFKPVTDVFVDYELIQTLNQAKINSTSLNNAYLKLSIEEMNHTTSFGEFFPSLSLRGAYGYSDDTFFPRYNNWNFGVSITIPLFSGGSSYFKTQEISHRINKIKEEIKEIQFQIHLKISELLNRYKMALKKKALTALKFKTAEESYRLTKLEYQQGKISYLWLEQKENELSALELDHEQTVYQIRIFHSEIEKYIKDETNEI